MAKFMAKIDKHDSDRCHIYRLSMGKPWLHTCVMHVDDVIELFGEVVLGLDVEAFSIYSVTIYPEGE